MVLKFNQRTTQFKNFLGFWRFFTKTVFIIVSMLVSNMGCFAPPDGPVVDLYESEIIKEKKVYKNGLLNGPFVTFYETGEIWVEGFYRDGKIDSSYISYYPSGKISEKGAYDMGRKQGAWWSNEYEGYFKSKEVNWVDGHPFGPIIYYDYRNNKKAIKSYKNGMHHGKWIYFDPQGQEEKYEIWDFGKRVEVGKF